MCAIRNIKVFIGKSGLNDIYEEWIHLLSKLNNRHFFHFYEWYKAYLDALEKDDEKVLFFLIENGPTLEAILPLRRKIKHTFGLSLNILESPSHPHLNLMDVIISKDANISGILDDFMNFFRGNPDYKCDVLKITRLLHDSELIRITANKTNYLNYLEHIGYCDYLKIIPYDDYLKLISKNFRGALRKARNKLHMNNEVEFIFTRDCSQLKQFYQEFLDVEASGWKGIKGEGTAIKLHKKLQVFYGNIIDTFSSFSGCEINLLRIKGTTVAAQFSLLAGNTIYILKIGYDEKWSHVAPGNLLLEYVMKRYSKSSEIQYINLVTDAYWHRSWKPDQFKVFNYYHFNSTIRGRTAFILLHAQKKVTNITSKIKEIKHSIKLKL